MQERSSSSVTATMQIGLFAKLWSWVSERLIQPLFSRHQQINTDYTQQLTFTLNAIHRDSANDQTHPKTVLLERNTEFENTESKIKPTIH